MFLLPTVLFYPISHSSELEEMSQNGFNEFDESATRQWEYFSYTSSRSQKKRWQTFN